MANLLLSVMGAMAEFERQLISLYVLTYFHRHRRRKRCGTTLCES